MVVDGAAVDVGVLLLFYVDVLLLFLLLLIPLSVLLTLMRCFENCIHYVRNKILGVGVESFCQEYKGLGEGVASRRNHNICSSIVGIKPCARGLWCVYVRVRLSPNLGCSEWCWSWKIVFERRSARDV